MEKTKKTIISYDNKQYEKKSELAIHTLQFVDQVHITGYGTSNITDLH